MNRSLRKSSAVGAAVASVALLSGCGSTPPPGVAATVDGQRITDEQVDELAPVVCALGVGPTTREARSFTLDLMVSDAVVAGLTEDGDVDRATVAAIRAQLETQRAAVPEDYQDRFDQLVEDVATTRAALIGLGRESLQAAGQQDVTDAVASQEGDRLLQEALADADVEIDPRFGRLEGGALVPGSGSLSVPVSDLAVAAVPDPEAEPDPAAYAELVPPAQRCGSPGADPEE